jgi:hypothetical protein
MKMRVNLRVVSGFVTGQVSPNGQPARDENERPNQNEQSGSPATTP